MPVKVGSKVKFGARLALVVAIITGAGVGVVKWLDTGEEEKVPLAQLTSDDSPKKPPFTPPPGTEAWWPPELDPVAGWQHSLHVPASSLLALPSHSISTACSPRRLLERSAVGLVSRLLPPL